MKRREAYSAYKNLTPDQQKTEIDRITYTMDVAGHKGINLGPGYAPYILMGRENVSWWSHPIRRKKMNKIGKEIQTKALHEDTELLEKNKLRQWLNRGDSSSRVEITWEATGKSLLHVPILIKNSNNSQTESFSMRSLLSVPPELEARLDPEDKQKLHDRQSFWAHYGVTSGPELQAFLVKNFKHTEILFDKKLPVELKWLKTAYPEDFAFLEELKKQNDCKIKLVSCIKTPQSVLDNVRSIAFGSQQKYVSTWVKDFIVKGYDPFILESDKKTLEDTFNAQRRGARRVAKDNPLLGEIIEKLAKEEYEKAINLNDGTLSLIREFLPMYKSLEVENKHTDPEITERIREINRKLTEGLGKDYALKRLLFDDAGNVTKMAEKFIITTAFVGAGAHALEVFLHMPGFAKFIAASFDDLTGEATELIALREIGVTLPEMAQRVKWLVPPAALAFLGAWYVEWSRKAFNDHVAGAQFMLSAVALSLVTSILSLNYFKKGYEDLAKDGKLHDYFPVLPKEQTETIKNEIQKLETFNKDDIWQGIETALKANGETDISVNEKRLLFERFAEGKEFNQILEQLKDPSTRTARWQAFKEAMGINPIRRGVAVGAFTAAPFGAIFGPLFLSIPFAYAAAGSYETFVGIGNLIGSKSTFPYRWRRYVKKEIKNLKGNKNPETDTEIKSSS